MTTDDDLLRQVTAYLDVCEGTTVLPESILDDIRAELPSTPQSRPRGLARFTDMSTPLKIGVAAAVVAVVAFLGLNWLGTIQVGPTPNASDHPTPSLDASVDAAALPPELLHVFLGPGKVADGTTASWVDFTSEILQFDTGGTLHSSPRRPGSRTDDSASSPRWQTNAPSSMSAPIRTPCQPAATS